MARKFKKDDKVRCINANFSSFLKLNEEYIIESYFEDSDNVILQENNCSYPQNRFELVNKSNNFFIVKGYSDRKFESIEDALDYMQMAGVLDYVEIYEVAKIRKFLKSGWVEKE